MNSLTRDFLALDRDAKVQAELEQKLIKNVVFRAPLNEVLCVLEKATCNVGGVRLLGTDVRRRKFENTKPSVTGEHRIVRPDLLSTSSEALLCDLCNICRLADSGAELGGHLLIKLLQVQRFRQLNKNIPSADVFIRVFSDNCVTRRATTRKEVNNKIVGFTKI